MIDRRRRPSMASFPVGRATPRSGPGVRPRCAGTVPVRGDIAAAPMTFDLAFAGGASAREAEEIFGT